MSGVLKLLSHHTHYFKKRERALVGVLREMLTAAIDSTGKISGDRLYIASTTDLMTGIGNRAYFYDVLRNSFPAALESEKPFAIRIVDMDNLKTINDAKRSTP